ncbi:MAG: hypothetical protein U0575_00760 [Phycisphaerales bacterium]
MLHRVSAKVVDQPFPVLLVVPQSPEETGLEPPDRVRRREQVVARTFAASMIASSALGSRTRCIFLRSSRDRQAGGGADCSNSALQPTCRRVGA